MASSCGCHTKNAATTARSPRIAPTSNKSTPSRITLDLNLGTAHLMDIIEGPAGYGCDSILIRYQASHSDWDDLADGSTAGGDPDEMPAAADWMDDAATFKSSSTASMSSSQVQQEHAIRQRRRYRKQLRRQLDEQIWFVMTSIERFATQFNHLALRFVGCTFPADALSWLLDRVDRIETLHVRVTFHGSLRHLGRSLRKHPKLDQVWIDHCRPSLEDVREQSRKSQRRRRRHLKKSSTPEEPVVATLEPILNGMAQSKTIRTVTLSHSTIAVTLTPPQPPPLANLDEDTAASTTTAVSTASFRPWKAGRSLSKLAQMPSLEKLSLERMEEVNDEDLACVASTLGDYHTLKTLSIRQCAVGPLTGSAIGSMLPRNRGLQTLDVNMHWWDGVSYEETAAGEYIAKCYETNVVPIVQGLRYNATLKCLGLYCDNLLAYHSSAAVVGVLGESVQARTNLQCATVLAEMPHIFQQHSTRQQKDAHDNSPFNCVLEDLIVGHRSFGLTTEIEFYLKWNRAGRHYFCHYENATRYDWLDAVLNHREDLSVVNALVAMNPTMFR
jgi:hypothetical protein